MQFQLTERKQRSSRLRFFKKISLFLFLFFSLSTIHSAEVIYREDSGSSIIIDQRCDVAWSGLIENSEWAGPILEKWAISVNTYHPEMVLKENLAVLLGKTDVTAELLSRTLEDYIERDFALLYRATKGIDPIRDTIYGLSREQHENRCVEFSRIIEEAKTPKEAAGSIFNILELSDDHPLRDKSPEEFLLGMQQARDSVIGLFMKMERKIKEKGYAPESLPDISEIKRLIYQVWKRNPVSLFSTYPAGVVWPPHRAFVHPIPATRDKNAELKLLFSQCQSATDIPRLIAQLRQRWFSRENNIYLRELLFLTNAEKMISTHEQLTAFINQIEHMYLEQIERRVNNDGVDSDDENHHVSEAIKGAMGAQRLIIAGKEYDLAVQHLMQWILSRLTRGYGLDYVPSIDLLKYYIDARDNYDNFLTQLEAMRDVNAIYLEINEFWNNNPITTVSLGATATL